MASSAMEEEIEISHELLPCYICGRTFLPCPLKKHIKVCERNATRKRKIFDSLKQRVEGTDLAPFHQPTFLKKTNENQPQLTAPVSAPEIGSTTQRSQSKWKEKHEEFVQTIRAAKGEKVMGPRRSISAVGTMGTTERCPYCERQFGPKSYDRHVDWCKEHKNRVMKSPANVVQAKERLEARTKYRVPPLNKSKRSITREKYSTSLSRTDSVVSVRSAGSVDRNGPERTILERSPSVRRSKAMVATHHHSAPEPIIKSKATVEKTKSPHTKQRPSAPKVNSPHVNESVEGMRVSKVNISFNEPTKLTSWKDIDETKRASKLIINSNEVSLAVNTDNSIVQMTDTGQLSISPLITNDKNIDILDNNESIFDDKENLELLVANEYLENAKPSNCNDIVTIKEPTNNNNYDMDSLYNEPETKLTHNRFTLNKAYSNLELNSTNVDDISEPDYKLQPCKSSHNFNSNDEHKMDKDSLESMTSGVAWEQADKDFLNSLKFKSNTSEMFSAELKTKYTSTPLQEKFDTGSFTMRCEKLNFKDFLVIDETISLPAMLLNVNDPNEVDVHDRTANIEDLSECFTDVSPKEIIQLPLPEYTVQAEHVIQEITLPDLEQKQFEDDEKFQTQLAEENATEAKTFKDSETNLVEMESTETHDNVDRPDYIDGKRQCNIEDLERFLGSQPDERQLEIEIIATEICPHDKQTGPCLNLYQTHSKEIIIEGQTCLETLNNLLSRNEVRSVNIIIVNEEICNEPNELEISNNQSVINGYKDRNVPFKKRISPRRSLKKKRNNGHRSPEPEAMEKLQSLHLPIMTHERASDNGNKRLKTDDFWMNTNELVSPLRIQKIELHEREFDKPGANRTVTFAKLPSLFNTPRDSEDGDTPRTNRDFRPCKLPIFSTPRYYSIPEEYNPFVVAEKQLMELLQCDDFKPYNTPTPPKNQSSKCAPLKSTIQNKNSKTNSNSNSKTPSAKRSSIIDPPDDFQDKMLLLQDNFELIENFINDNYVSNDTIISQKLNAKSKVNNHSDSNRNKTANGLSLNCILSGRKYSDDMNSIDPSLINETDNLSIPDKLPLDNYCSPTSSTHELDHYSVQYDKKISVFEPAKNDKIKRSLSSQDEQTLDDIDFDEFISSFDDDESFPTLKSFLQSTKSDKSEKKIVQKSTLSLNSSFGKNIPAKGPDIKKPITPLKRSVSLSNPVVKARSMKNKQDIQEYLHAKDTKPAKKVSPKLDEELFPPDHEMYEEYKKYKDLYKQEKNEFIAEEKKATMGEGDYDEISSNEDAHVVRKLHAVKVSGDSAYGRKSPKIQPRASSNRHGQMPLRSSVERSPSSSGSETSVTVPAGKTKSRIPKFCHECGTKYPVDVAKFCVECGVKRLVL